MFIPDRARGGVRVGEHRHRPHSARVAGHGPGSRCVSRVTAGAAGGVVRVVMASDPEVAIASHRFAGATYRTGFRRSSTAVSPQLQQRTRSLSRIGRKYETMWWARAA